MKRGFDSSSDSDFEEEVVNKPPTKKPTLLTISSDSDNECDSPPPVQPKVKHIALACLSISLKHPPIWTNLFTVCFQFVVE